MVKARNSIMSELAEVSPGVHKLLELRSQFDSYGFTTTLHPPHEASFTAVIKLSDWEIKVLVEFTTESKAHHIGRARKSPAFDMEPVDEAVLRYICKTFAAEPTYWTWNTKVHGPLGAVTVDIAQLDDGVIRAYVAEYELED